MKPTSSQARLAVTVLVNAGKLDQARKIIAQVEPNERADLHAAIAAAYDALDQIKPALAEYQNALHLNPSHPEAQRGAVGILALQAAELVKAEDYAAASSLLKKALELDNKNPKLRDFATQVEITALMAGKSSGASVEVLQVLEEIYSRDPTRIDIAHQLAMFYHRQAVDIDEGFGKPGLSQQMWESALAYWGVTLASDEYWKQWAANRQATYQSDKAFTDEELEKLRFEGIRLLIREVNSLFAAAYSTLAKKKEVNRHKMIMADWVVECSTAKAMAATLAFLKKRRQPTLIEVAGGPLYWKKFKIEAKAQQAAQAALALDRSFVPAKEVQDSLGVVSKARAMQKEGLLDEALNILRPYVSKNPADGDAKSLLVELLLKQAETLVHDDIEAALNCWSEAKKLGAPSAQVDEAIVNNVLEQEQKLINEGKQTKAEEILVTAIRLVPSATPIKNEYYRVRHEAIKSKFDSKTGGSGVTPARLKSAVEEAKTAYRQLDQVIGPNHPRVRERIAELDGLGVGIQVSNAIDRANKAIEGFGNDRLTFKQTDSELASALSDLQEAQRVTPNDNHIREQITAINNVRAKIRSAEAGRLNQEAVNKVNEAASDARSGSRYSAISELESALELIAQAMLLDSNNPTIRENANQIATMLKSIRGY